MSRAKVIFFLAHQSGYHLQLLQLILLVHLLIQCQAMENGERLVHRRRCTVCLCLANLNKEGWFCTTIFWDLCQVRNLPGGQCSSGQWTNGERLEVCVQWKMESRPAARKTAAPAPAPSPRAWDGPEWRLAMELCPRYADYGQWSLRII